MNIVCALVVKHALEALQLMSFLFFSLGTLRTRVCCRLDMTRKLEDVLCVVCMSPIVDPVCCAHCRHMYCRVCVEEYLSRRCVQCKGTRFVAARTEDVEHCRASGKDGRLGVGLLTAKSCLDGTSSYTAHLPPSSAEQQIRSLIPSEQATHEQGLIEDALPEHNSERLDGQFNLRIIRSPRRAVQVQEALKAVNKDTANPEAWYVLAEALRYDEDVTIGGARLSRVACYCSAIALRPVWLAPWQGLGSCMPQGSVVFVGGKSYSKRDCFVRCVEMDDAVASVWCSLGHEMMDDEVLVLFTLAMPHIPLKVRKLDCFIRALRWDPYLGAAYAEIARILNNDEVVAVNGARVGRKECCRLALQLNRACSLAWRVLGEVMQPGELFSLGNGEETVGSDECLMTAETLEAKQRPRLQLQRFR